MVVALIVDVWSLRRINIIRSEGVLAGVCRARGWGESRTCLLRWPFLLSHDPTLVVADY